MHDNVSLRTFRSLFAAAFVFIFPSGACWLDICLFNTKGFIELLRFKEVRFIVFFDSCSAFLVMTFTALKCLSRFFFFFSALLVLYLC